MKRLGGTPKLVSAAQNFVGFSEFPVDSVKRESNSDGSPVGEGHLTGNAVDVGVPDNKEGFEYIVRAIQSGQFSEIGTNPRWIPVLEEYAKQFGVRLFSDYKQVHAHLQVAF